MAVELFKPKPMEPLGHNIVAQIVSKKHREKLVRGPHDNCVMRA
jgi:hypothetical protein